MATARRTTRTTSRAKAAPKGNVIEVTFEDYVPSQSYMGEEPRPGIYRFELRNVEQHTSGEGNVSIRWTFVCTDAPYKGWIGSMYTNMDQDGSRWKTQQNVAALLGKTTAVTLDLDNPEKFLKACKIVIGRVVADEYNGEMRGKLRTVAADDGTVKSTKPSLDDDEDPDDEDIDEDEEEEEEDDFDDEDEEEEEDEDDEEDDEEEEDEEDEDDDEDEEEEEEEEEPAPPARRARRTPAKAAATAAKPAPRKAATKRTTASAKPATRARRAK